MSKPVRFIVVVIIATLISGTLPITAQAEETMSRGEVLSLFVAVAQDLDKINARLERLERMITLAARWMEITDKQLEEIASRQDEQRKALAAVIYKIRQEAERRGRF